MNIDQFIKGKKPECPIPPNFKHTKVIRSGKKTKCLWCKKVLDK